MLYSNLLVMLIIMLMLMLLLILLLALGWMLRFRHNIEIEVWQRF